MNKTKFLELVRNPDLIQEKDLTKLNELISEHPYSQIIHILKVKGSKVFDKPDYPQSLNLAATYTYDRSILRTVLEGSVVENNSNNSQTVAASEPSKEEQFVEETSDFEWIHEDDDDDIFVDEITETISGKEQEIIGIQEEVPTTDDQVQEIADEETPENQDEKPESIIASEGDNAAPDTNVSTEPEQQETESSDDKGFQDSLNMEIEAGSIHAELMRNLNQLQESKQQYDERPDENGDPKSRDQQIEIIDNFIKNSPVLSKPNLSAESEGVSQDDLSKESSQLSVELVSENLARIYFKQGKSKDAEKIYKKLIRKFPQKKAYFADQIQKLKKK